MPPSDPGFDGDAALVVQTRQGAVRGRRSGGCRLFVGLPFAAPPTGANRWRPPQPAPAWPGIRDAGGTAPVCAQLDTVTGMPIGQEDCLYLNVTVPAGAGPDRLRPVMVWIHGGGFVSFSGTGSDLRRLAAHGDVVVVSLNYRLGVFGFFGAPGLADGGAFGFQDQQAGLRWVQDNIAAFGGDPGNVTLFGISAGGISIGAHLTTPGSKGLFHRAIVQSGASTMDWPAGTFGAGVPYFPSVYMPLAICEATGATVARERWGVSPDAAGIDALRGLPTSELLAVHHAFGSLTWGGETVPGHPATMLRAGTCHAGAVIIGNTRDEHTTWVSEVLDGEGLIARTVEAFGDLAPQVRALYPADAFDTPSHAWAKMCSDRVWTRASFEMAQLAARLVPTWSYLFAESEVPPLFGAAPAAFTTGAFHGADVPFLTDDPDVRLTPRAMGLSEAIIGYWSRFAAHGDPTGGGAPEWAPFGAALPPVTLSLAADPGGIHPIDLARQAHLDLWQADHSRVAA